MPEFTEESIKFLDKALEELKKAYDSELYISYVEAWRNIAAFIGKQTDKTVQEAICARITNNLDQSKVDSIVEIMFTLVGQVGDGDEFLTPCIENILCGNPVIGNAFKAKMIANKKLAQKFLTINLNEKILQTIYPFAVNDDKYKTAENIRSDACAYNNINLLRLAIKMVEPDKLADFIVEPPSFRSIRMILGYLSWLPQRGDFKADPLWVLLEDIVSTQKNNELINKITAEVLIQWPLGNSIRMKVVVAATSLFNLGDKIKKRAKTNLAYNPLFLSIDRLDIQPSALLKFYIEDHASYKHITHLNNAVDKIKLLKYLIEYYNQLSDVPNYENYITSIVKDGVLDKLDMDFFDDLGAYGGSETLKPIFVTKILQPMGFKLPPHEINYRDLKGTLNESQIKSGKPIACMLAGTMQIGNLVDAVHKVKSGEQSAHDKVLAGNFDTFTKKYQEDSPADLISNKEQQGNYIKLFTLFTLFKLNAQAAIFLELFKDSNIKDLFSNAKDFPAFVLAYNALLGKTPIPSIEFALTGINPEDSKINVNAINAAINSDPKNDFELQALRSFRAVRGTNAERSHFLMNEKIRVGTVCLIQYIHSNPAEYLPKVIRSRLDILAILQRLPEDKQDEIVDGQGDRQKLLALYDQYAKVDFSYEQYKDQLEKIFATRLAYDRENICQYIAMSANAYSEGATATEQSKQSCEEGCKARLYTILNGDMLYGARRGRLELMEDCVYKVMLAKLKDILRDKTITEVREILANHLSVRVANAALYAQDQNADLNQYFQTNDLNIQPLTALFDNIDQNQLWQDLCDKFNKDPWCNPEQEKGELNAKEKRALLIMIQMGGGEVVVKRLDEYFRPTYGIQDTQKISDAGEEDARYVELINHIMQYNPEKHLVGMQAQINKTRFNQSLRIVAELMQENDPTLNEEKVEAQGEPIVQVLIAAAQKDKAAAEGQVKNNLQAAINSLKAGNFQLSSSPSENKNQKNTTTTIPTYRNKI